MSVDPEELVGDEEPQEPIAHARITYTGPVAPHWDITHEGGDETAVDEFRARAMARLQLLPPHDPQFRRNRERVNRDAERELIELAWDLGYEEGAAEEVTSLGDKPTPTGPLVGADDTEVTGEEAGEEASAGDTPAGEPAAAETSDEKASDEKASDEKASDEPASDEKASDEKASDEKASDEAPRTD